MSNNLTPVQQKLFDVLFDSEELQDYMGELEAFDLACKWSGVTLTWFNHHIKIHDEVVAKAIEDF